jgi:hypothetical protein
LLVSLHRLDDLPLQLAMIGVHSRFTKARTSNRLDSRTLLH